MSDGADRNGGGGGARKRRHADERERREKRDGITRKDFLDGAAVSAAGLAAAAAFPGLTGSQAMAKATADQPACRRATTRRRSRDPYTGLPAEVIRTTIKIDGPPPSRPASVHSTKGGPGINARVDDTGEQYDCVIVGAGASGIAAAKCYRDRFGPNKRILIVDALPDFGGHSHRNEWHIPNAADGNADVTILRNGGTVNLDSIGTWNQDAPGGIPGSYGQPAVDFLDWAGVDVTTATKWQNGGAAGIPASFGLYQRLLFPAAEFGSDHVIAGPERRAVRRARARHGGGLDGVPRPHAVLAGRAGTAILRVQTADEDFLANAPGAPLTQEQKRDYLTTITYKQYLRNHAGVNDEAFYGEYWRGSGGLLGAGGQAVSAADCWILGRPGFPDGVGLGDTEDIELAGIGRTPFQDSRSTSGPTRAWPDGNTSLLRLALSKLVPNAFPDVNVGDGPAAPGPAEHPQGERAGTTSSTSPSNGVRVRLNATVFNVEPCKAAATTRPSTTCSTTCAGTAGQDHPHKARRAGASGAST